MPIVHQNFDLLKNKIQTKFEVDKTIKRVGQNTTFIIEVDEFNYNWKYPILDPEKFSKWFTNHSKRSKSVEEGAHHSKKDHNRPEKPNGTERSENGQDKPRERGDSEVLQGAGSQEKKIEKDGRKSPKKNDRTYRDKLDKEDGTKRKKKRDDSDLITIELGESGDEIGNHNDISLCDSHENAAVPSFQKDDDELGDNGGVNSIDLQDDEDRRTSEELAQSELDTLVIKEACDEYRCYDDSDEEESELTKNRKKIRSEPTRVASTNHRHNQEPTANSFLNSSGLFPPRQNDQRVQQPREPNQQSDHQQQQRQQQKQQQVISHQNELPVEQEPDWKVLSKQLTESSFDKYVLVHQNLNHYKNKMKLSESGAHSLLKEVILKCFAKDETFHLLDFFKLLFECDCGHDETFLKFVAELVQRLRRKINPHANCHTFQSKANPEVVMGNYRLALSKMAQYIKEKNLKLNLLFSDFEFLYQTVMCQPTGKLRAVKKEEPRENLPPQGNGPGASIEQAGDQAEVPTIQSFNVDIPPPPTTHHHCYNDKTINGKHSTDCLGDGEPAVQRIVVNHINPNDGKPCFKIITTQRKRVAGGQLRKRL